MPQVPAQRFLAQDNERRFMSRCIVIIPARMEAARLPGKPLADICGKPMILHVWERAMAADIGRVVIATDSHKIADCARAAGAEAQMTRADHQSGSDRAYEALTRIDPDQMAESIISLQGDLPTLEPELVRQCLEPLVDPDVAITTLAAEIQTEEERLSPSVVKVVGSDVNARRPDLLRALYFTRATAPANAGPLYHHIGIYGYRRRALEAFVNLPQSPLEQREKLEQLRALEHGMRIEVAIVDTVPLGVDTPADLERARDMLRAGS
jgi:3-deoxy-manno-octulosonate cytidylyltransferase (CMP-KDO synthetase)